ncbi:MAG: RagB/SusD family nutrient uptake outer membrane protein [Bacteroidales bacterium]|jgi:tetratricopeptide (TPR) repeat protein|nr:RagB/SusD family nutrient uptake outer membrane protein [Bacteroidales bacterium]
MKKIEKLMCILLAGILCACSSDILDKNDPTKLNSGGFYRTETQVEQAVVGVYSQLQEYISNEAWQFGEMISDNTTVHFDPMGRASAPANEAVEYWQLVSNTGNVGSLYNRMYRNLANINLALYRMGAATVSETAKSNFEGQLRFMRAFYYFSLVQYFGDVIVVTEPITNPDQAWDYVRSPISEVNILIDSDLKFAVEVLPAKNTKVGYATKGAALMLQGRIFLARKQYVEAIATFRQITQLGYQLLPDYADVFDPAKKNHAESIMDVQFQGGNDLGEHSGFLYNFYPRDSYGAVIPFPGRSGGGWNVPTLDIIGDYEEGDLRKAVSLKEGYTSNEGEWVAVPYINKYNHPHTIEGRPDDNWPLMRYAETLLSLAEAINETEGPTAEAFGYLNQIRQRAGLQPVSNLTKEEFRRVVFHERRIELAFENHRWLDLKRTMTPAELAEFLNAYGVKEKSNPTTSRGTIPFNEYDFKFDSFEAYLPIPLRETRLNKNLRQNEGYE